MSTPIGSGISIEDFDYLAARSKRGLGRGGTLDSDVESLSVSGQPINGIYGVLAPLDFPNTPAQQGSDLTVSVPGAKLGDVVTLGVPAGSVNPHSMYFGYVSAPDVVTVRFCNFSAGAIDPATGDFRVTVIAY